MLHLDHNHTTSALSPHTKPNLILSDTPQPDQHSVLSWSAPATDDETFKPDGNKDQSVANKPPTPPSQPDPPPSLEPAVDAEPPSDITPADADDPKPPELSPSSPLDATSPALESNSSLTPPPDSTSPAFPPVALPVGEPSSQPNLEPSEDEPKSKPEEGTEAVDAASRASTPLSELSSAPDGDDPPNVEKKEGEETVDDPPVSQDNGGAQPEPETNSEVAKVEETKPVNGHVEPPTESPAPVPTATPASAHHTSHINQDVPTKSEVVNDVDPQTQHLATPEPPTHSMRSPSKLDPRVVTILELNAHLLKVSMEFQARGISMEDPIFQQYGRRLQSNLTWLAATADANRKVSHSAMNLPIMHVPPQVDFVATDRIQQLYSELPTLFAKDLMRRQSLTGNGPVPQMQGNTNGHLKRERSDDPPGDISNKRRDTGDSKIPTPGPATPSSHHSPNMQTPNPMAQSATPPHNIPLQNLSNASLRSPSMPPPSMPSGMLPNEAQAMAANMLRRSRMSVGAADGNRSMQPIASSSQVGPMQNMAGPSAMPTNQQQMGGGMNQLSPGVMQSLQVLQDPSHPATRYLSAQVPGFSTLPIQQQLHHLQRMQLIMQARKGQSQQQQHHPAASIQGFSQGQQNGGMPGQMGVHNGSPTRISSQQSPMPPQGSFPFGNQGGMDPRTANAMGGANMPLDPQRRQLLLMQQQQNMMRNTAIFNQQRLAAQQQAGGSPHIGSPMLGGSADGNAFPALRSNPSVPGIARSTRTPSDHAPSPLTPQLSGGRSEEMQRAMMQQQRNMFHGQNPGMAQMAGMGGMNPSWPQTQQPGPMPHGQGSYSMSPPGSAGFGNMPGGAPSPASGQQWSQPGGGSFAFNAASPPAGQPSDGNPRPGSRQTSATPAPLQQQPMPQNSPMGDQAGLSDFDIFTWGQ